MDLFSYAVHPNRIKNRIGQFVASEVSDRKKTSTIVKTLNFLDRYDLAEQFISYAENNAYNRFYNDLGDSYNTSEFLNEIALFIDVTIPKAYNKYVRHIEGEYSIENTGLVYYFDNDEMTELSRQMNRIRSQFNDEAHNNVEIIELNVPFVEKDQAKALGAKWDPKKKTWYLRGSHKKELFKRWLPKSR
ncbi:DUF5710 domain-containing protein [Virgibacillus salexigens]|uniref:DUF5710 domain-containing protein n=1 Tax=Virgibacillus salexigens TaxID=61016 RepID=UPI00190BB790|nr:DUF5710 domain-containing protein [Virgibacillus salexigens]